MHSTGRTDEAWHLLDDARAALSRAGERASPNAVGTLHRVRGRALYEEGRLVDSWQELDAELSDLRAHYPGSIPWHTYFCSPPRRSPLSGMQRRAANRSRRLWSYGKPAGALRWTPRRSTATTSSVHECCWPAAPSTPPQLLCSPSSTQRVGATHRTIDWLRSWCSRTCGRVKGAGPKRSTLPARRTTLWRLGRDGGGSRRRLHDATPPSAEALACLFESVRARAAPPRCPLA